jgi:hypothetical protein
MPPLRSLPSLPLLLALIGGVCLTPLQAEVPQSRPTPPPAATTTESVLHRARKLCALLLDTPVEIAPPQLVSQKPGQLFPTELPPVWHLALRETQSGACGHLLLETDEPLTLHEFAFDFPSPPTPRNGAWIAAVPNLQQFPTPPSKGSSAPPVASGCVPTAGASLVGFWALQGFAQWLPNMDPKAPKAAPEALQSATLRLRQHLEMVTFPDDSGYTDNAMPLSGANPEQLAEALRKDASQHGVSAEIESLPFNPSLLQESIRQRRPVLLSCIVRLPHKPQLSWGHEVLGVGFDHVEGVRYVGIVDNFFPTAHPHTIRWIRDTVFEDMITVRCR